MRLKVSLWVGIIFFSSCGPSPEQSNYSIQEQDNKSLRSANCPPGVAEGYTQLHESDKTLAKEMKTNLTSDQDAILENLTKIKEFRKQVAQYGEKYPHVVCYGLNNKSTLVLIDVDAFAKGSLVSLDKAILSLEELM